jgi:hypothetical protein
LLFVLYSKRGYCRFVSVSGEHTQSLQRDKDFFASIPLPEEKFLKKAHPIKPREQGENEKKSLSPWEMLLSDI